MEIGGIPLRSVDNSMRCSQILSYWKEAQRDARQDALQRQDEQWKRINDEYELAKKEYATNFEMWKAMPRDQCGEKPQALKQLMKKKDIPMDIPHDEEGLDNASVDGDYNTNTQDVPSDDED